MQPYDSRVLVPEETTDVAVSVYILCKKKKRWEFIFDGLGSLMRVCVRDEQGSQSKDLILRNCSPCGELKGSNKIKLMESRFEVTRSAILISQF